MNIKTDTRSITLRVDHKKNRKPGDECTRYTAPYYKGERRNHDIGAFGSILDLLGFDESEFPDGWDILVTVNAPYIEKENNQK